MSGVLKVLQPERPARERWESKTKDGTNITFQGGCQDSILVAVDCFVHKPEMENQVLVEGLLLVIMTNGQWDALLTRFIVQGNPNAIS